MVPANDPDGLCPQMGGFGALRRVLAARVLEARVDFGVWRNRLAALDERFHGTRIRAHEIEGLTNVGQALIASELLHLETSENDLSTLITTVVGRGHGYSQPSVSRWLTKLKTQ